MKYIKGKNYQVTEDVIVTLPFRVPTCSVAGGMVKIQEGQRITAIKSSTVTILGISKGWTWDGASFFLFKWFGTPERWIAPSLYHDALYEPIRKGIIGREYREPIDKMFRDKLIERGVSKWEAQIAYWCIRVGGNFAVRHWPKEDEVI